MSEIVIIENEKQMVEGSFDAMNIAFYNGNFTFKYFSNSQEALSYEALKDSYIIFVDIELSPKSEMDGFNLVKILEARYGTSRIAILTGYINFESILKDAGYNSIPVLRKPIDFIKLNSFIVQHFPQKKR